MAAACFSGLGSIGGLDLHLSKLPLPALKSYDFYQQKINAGLAGIDFPASPPNLYEPIKYLLGFGGKRLRPVLLLMANDLYGGNPDEAMPAALAVEVFHNFTLMHDDIMDKAPLRRGLPTVHTKWNTASAILSGDQMLVWAYHLLAGVPASCFADVQHLFTRTAAAVCEGQQHDMDFEQRPAITEGEYIRMITQKTAVLLAASLQMGALLAGAEPAEQEKLYGFGLNLGIAFQLQDDLLDVFGHAEKVGKMPGGDIAANKKTYLWLLAQAHGNSTQLNELSTLAAGNDAGKVAAITALYRQIGVDVLAAGKKNEYMQFALEQLHSTTLPAHAKTYLEHLAGELMHRMS